MTRRTPDDRPGGDFCEIEGEAPSSGHVYHPIRSDDLVWLAKEVWSIMDRDQRHEFFHVAELDLRQVRVVGPLSSETTWTAPAQDIPPGGFLVVWDDADPSAGYRKD